MHRDAQPAAFHEDAITMLSRPLPCASLSRPVAAAVLTALLVLPSCVLAGADDDTTESTKPETAKATTATAGPAKEEPVRRLYRGQVVNLRDALKERGIRASGEFDDQYVLATTDGRLIPIVPDWRGRAFYQDKRLRNRPLQLVGSQPEGLPWLQVLMVFLVDEQGHRKYMDYWCDICSIPMYQIKPCDCCQAPIRLRFQTKPLPGYLPAGDRRKPEHPQAGRKLPAEEPLPGAEGAAEH